jgi:hypothetical protein
METLDFDAEAKALWARLNIDPTSVKGGLYNPMDPIWRHPTGGGTIYVGNQGAAQSLDFLRSNGITHVVNCTSGPSKIPNYHEGALKYYVFPVSIFMNIVVKIIAHSRSDINDKITYWNQYVDETDSSVLGLQIYA